MCRELAVVREGRRVGLLDGRRVLRVGLLVHELRDGDRERLHRVLRRVAVVRAARVDDARRRVVRQHLGRAAVCDAARGDGQRGGRRARGGRGLTPARCGR